MMHRFEDRRDLATKVSWEGGLEDALEYGIKHTDMPAGDTELANAWWAMEAAWHIYESYRDDVDRLLPDPDV